MIEGVARSPTATATPLAMPCRKDRSCRVNSPAAALPTSSTPNAHGPSPRMGTPTMRWTWCSAIASGARMRPMASSWRNWTSWPVSHASRAVVARSAATRVRPTMRAGQPTPACSTKAPSSARYRSTPAIPVPVPSAAARHASWTTASRSSSKRANASRCAISAACRKEGEAAPRAAPSVHGAGLGWYMGGRTSSKRPGRAPARCIEPPAASLWERDAQGKEGGTRRHHQVWR